MKSLRILLIGTMALMWSFSSFSQTYPNRAVRIVVAYQAGQGTDVATRYMADLLGKALGQSVYVENKAGAAGNIGTAAVAQSPADGYTLVMGTNGTHVLNQFLYSSVGFDSEKDFEPIVLVGTFPMALLTSSSSKFQTLKDVLDASASGSKGADIAMPSTTARLVLELLKERSKVELFGVPYKGSGAATTDVIGGQLPLLIDTVSAARPFVQSGKLRPITVTSLKSSELMPGAEPVSQQGFAGFEVIAWNGLYAPRGTPVAVIQRINEEVNKLLAQEDVRRRLLQLGIEPAGGSPAKFGEFAANERKKWGPLIARAGIKAD